MSAYFGLLWRKVVGKGWEKRNFPWFTEVVYLWYNKNA